MGNIATIVSLQPISIQPISIYNPLLTHIHVHILELQQICAPFRYSLVIFIFLVFEYSFTVCACAEIEHMKL